MAGTNGNDRGRTGASWNAGEADDAASAPTREQRLAEQRRGLPDQPGVYLFRNAKGTVIYVGKAKSIKKRVASHFSNPSTQMGRDLLPMIERIDSLVVTTESEALLTEQNFIKQYKPRFNIRLRDDKSYPYIGISLDEAYPRVYFTRERHRRERAYFGPYSNAKRVRETLELLGRVFMYRTCEGPEPGRHSGSPCLDYYIKRCTAPCVGYISQEEYRDSIDGIVDFLSGRYRQIERAIEQGMKKAAAEQRFEDAALARNRLRAIRSLLERQRVSNESVGTLDAVALAVDGTEANAQVFQVRDGILSDRQSFYLENQAADDLPAVAEAFLLQYYGDAIAIPPLLVVQRDVGALPVVAEALAQRRGGSVELRAAERGDKRRILELAERNARLALDQERLRGERRRQQRVEALERLQEALGLDAIPLRVECFDISNLGGTHTVASMVVFEGGAPKKADYRRFTLREGVEGVPDDFASMEEVLGRRLAQYERQHDRSPHDEDYDASLRRAAERRRDRRRQGPAVGWAAGTGGLPPPRRRDRLAREADRGGVRARPSGSDRARARDARAAAAPARARRGAPLRDRPSPHPPRQGDDDLRAGRSEWRRPGAQARAAAALRLAGGVPGGEPRAARGGSGAARQGRARRLRAAQQDGPLTACSRARPRRSAQ